MCHCGNTRMEGTPNKSQHTKLTLEKNILLLLLPGFKLTTFRSQVTCSYLQAVPVCSLIMNELGCGNVSVLHWIMAVFPLFHVLLHMGHRSPSHLVIKGILGPGVIEITTKCCDFCPKSTLPTFSHW